MAVIRTALSALLALALLASSGCSPLYGVSAISPNFSQQTSSHVYDAEHDLSLSIYVPGGTPEASDVEQAEQQEQAELTEYVTKDATKNVPQNVPENASDGVVASGSVDASDGVDGYTADYPTKDNGLEDYRVADYSTADSATEPARASTAESTGLPVVVFFYGGGWQAGKRQQYRFVGGDLTAQGFIAVLPDYRLYPKVSFPTFVEDGAAALRWTLDNIADYGGDPDRVFLAGHSAGAHIAALLHLDEKYLSDAGVDKKHCGFIGLSGPYDFAPLMGDKLNSIFPAGTEYDSQPLNFVTGTEGPVLLIHGLKDNTVKPRGAKKLNDALVEAGVDSELVIYPKRGHAGVLLSTSRTLRFLAPTTQQIKQFVNETDCSVI